MINLSQTLIAFRTLVRLPDHAMDEMGESYNKPINSLADDVCAKQVQCRR